MTGESEETQAEASAEPSETERIDRRAAALLAAAYAAGQTMIFEGNSPEDLTIDKKAADRLSQLRLATYPDEARDSLAITNSGRYWALNGGYLAFLKEDPPTGGGGRGRNPEMEALRFTYMKLRLSTFWLSLGMSIAGFLISIVSLAVAYYYRGLLLN